MNRRTILLSTAAAIVSSQAYSASVIRETVLPAGSPEKKAKTPTDNDTSIFPKIPKSWYGKGMYEGLIEGGTGIYFQNFNRTGSAAMKGRPALHVCFDPQCRWCTHLHRQLEPLYGKVPVIWYPVATLNVWSEPQGAAILASPDPWKAFLAHMDNFRREAPARGNPVDTSALWTEEMVRLRNAVWNNSKIFRRNGCLRLPTGVFLNSRGEYVCIYSGMKTKELARLLEVSLSA